MNYELQKEITALYLQGSDPKELAKKYELTTAGVKQIIDNDTIRSEVERTQTELYKARENKRLHEIKNDLLSFIHATIKEAKTSPNKLQYMDKVQATYTTLDKILRLNRGDSTENTSHKETIATLNINELLASLDTQEKQDDFLRKQMENNICQNFNSPKQ